MTEKDRWGATHERLTIIRLAIDGGPAFTRLMVTSGRLSKADETKLFGLLDPRGKGRPTRANPNEAKDQQRILRPLLLDRLNQIKLTLLTKETAALKGETTPRERALEQLCLEQQPTKRKELINQRQEIEAQHEDVFDEHCISLLSSLEEHWQAFKAGDREIIDTLKIDVPQPDRSDLDRLGLAELIEALMGSNWRPTPRVIKNLLGWK